MSNSQKKEGNILPSKHQIFDSVTLDFGDAGKINECQVIRIHFTESKVMYDVHVNDVNTRLYNVDSCFVLPIEDEQATEM